LEGSEQRKEEMETINESIEMEEWKEYFKGVMGGVERRVIWQRNRSRSEEERELGLGEVRKMIGKLKNRKAMGVDEVPNEVWKYGGEDLVRWVWGLCNRIWRGEGWPEKWKEGVIVPIVKRGRREGVKDYRGVILMPTLYKIYTAALAERLREEIEEKGLIPPNQAGFRRGMGTDKIFVLNHIINS